MTSQENQAEHLSNVPEVALQSYITKSGTHTHSQFHTHTHTDTHTHTHTHSHSYGIQDIAVYPTHKVRTFYKLLNFSF